MIRGVTALAALALVACGGGEDGGEPPAAARRLPYASEVVRFEPGEEAGYGDEKLPDVVLGPPKGKGLQAGSLDVLSLGKGGSIELGFGTGVIVDVEGPDFVVFENAFWPGGDATAVFAEVGAVSVSEDGETWLEFPCDAEGDGEGPSAVGGDAFDLADVGLGSARFVRILDRSHAGASPSAGFDLDAVGVVELGSTEPAR
jgi:hypothetical protein